MSERAAMVWEWIVAAHDGAGPVSLAALCRAAVRFLGVDGASVTAVGGLAAREPLFASDQLSARPEELQFTVGDGPATEESGAESPTRRHQRHHRYHPGQPARDPARRARVTRRQDGASGAGRAAARPAACRWRRAWA